MKLIPSEQQDVSHSFFFMAGSTTMLRTPFGVLCACELLPPPGASAQHGESPRRLFGKLNLVGSPNPQRVNHFELLTFLIKFSVGALQRKKQLQRKVPQLNHHTLARIKTIEDFIGQVIWLPGSPPEVSTPSEVFHRRRSGNRTIAIIKPMRGQVPDPPLRMA